MKIKPIGRIVSLFEQATGKMVTRANSGYKFVLATDVTCQVTLNYMEQVAKEYVQERIDSCESLAEMAAFDGNHEDSAYYQNLANNWKYELDRLN